MADKKKARKDRAPDERGEPSLLLDAWRALGSIRTTIVLLPIIAAATTIVIASGTGIPISTTHTLVGAVLGVGVARGIEAIDLRVVARIFVSWVVTIPAGAILAIVFFFVFKTVLP